MSYVSERSKVQKTLNGEEYLKLKNLPAKERLLAVQEAPYVLPMLWTNWKSDANIDKIVLLAIAGDANVFKQLQNKPDFVATKDYVNMAVESEPRFIFDLTDEQKDMIETNTIISAFQKNPVVLASNCKALKERVKLTFDVQENGKVTKKEINPTIKSQLQLALRLAEGVSDYHKGYDDFALPIAEALQKSQLFGEYKNQPKVVENIPTVVNAMIKKQDQRLRCASEKTWKLYNNKVLHFAVKSSARENSQLEGIINDLPISQFDDKLVERLIVAGLKVNPKFYNQLSSVELAKYKSSSKVKKAYLQSLISHGYPTKEILKSLPQAEAKKFIIKAIDKDEKIFDSLEKVGAEEFKQDRDVLVAQFKSLYAHSVSAAEFAKTLDEPTCKKAVAKTTKRYPSLYENLQKFGLERFTNDLVVAFAYRTAVKKSKHITEEQKTQKLEKMYSSLAGEAKSKFDAKVERAENASKKAKAKTAESQKSEQSGEETI